MAKPLWAGLDISADTTRVCVIDNRGEVVHEDTYPTDVTAVRRGLAVLRKRESALVAMETGCGAALARGLEASGYRVIVFEARALSKFLRLNRNKTDAGDAFGIAQAARLGAALVPKVLLKSIDCQYLSSRLTIRRFLVRARVKALTLLCRQLELYGGRVRTRQIRKAFFKDVEQQIRTLFGRPPNALATELRYLLSHCETLLAHQKAVDNELLRLARENEVCRRFMEIPGSVPFVP